MFPSSAMSLARRRWACASFGLSSFRACFFFSSRRRHTRSLCDWSSDVCSSDLENVAAALDLSEDAVKQRLSRGRKLLHEQVVAFVEGALERTSPGKAFTIGVLAAIPAFTISAKAATVGVTAAKGGTIAKTAAASGLFTAMLAPALGFFGNYIGYRIGMEGAQSDHEREFIKSFYRKLLACMIGFCATYGLLVIWAKEFIKDRHFVYRALIIGLVLPFALMIF